MITMKVISATLVPLNGTNVNNINNIYWFKTFNGYDLLALNRTTGQICNDKSDAKSLIEFNSLTISEENKVCVNGSDEEEINGKYTWFFYDQYMNGSVYYNIENEKFLYPFISDSGFYFWKIDNDSRNGDSNMRCKVEGAFNAKQSHMFDVNDCVNNWEVYTNGTWVLNRNIFVTGCQDICVEGSD
eukprot:661472_1